MKAQKKTIRSVISHLDLRKMVVDLTPPFISAKSWVIADGKTGRVFFGKSEFEKREIASLTKIMSMLTALHLAEELAINIYTESVTVSEKAATIQGTTAGLQQGDTLAVVDLMHAMMLPSGNDAAVAVAEHFGRLLSKSKSHNTTATSMSIELEATKISIIQRKEAIVNHFDVSKDESLFVEEMNKMAADYKLKKTSFLNSHGKISIANISSAVDLAKMTRIAMMNDTFQTIARKPVHICSGRTSSGKLKQFTWMNTNKLLGKDGCRGVKTGITETAGPCYVGSFYQKGFSFIIVLLNSKSMEARWFEAIKLKTWAQERLREIEKMAKNNKRNQRKILLTLKHI